MKRKVIRREMCFVYLSGKSRVLHTSYKKTTFASSSYLNIIAERQSIYGEKKHVH